jgi:hypothetical protein
VCAFFSLLFFLFEKKYPSYMFLSSFVNTKKNICLFCLSSDFLFVQLTDLCVCMRRKVLFFFSSSSFVLFLLVCVQRKK